MNKKYSYLVPLGHNCLLTASCLTFAGYRTTCPVALSHMLTRNCIAASMFIEGTLRKKLMFAEPCTVRLEGFVDRDLGVADGSVYLHTERYTEYFKQADIKNYQNIMFNALFIYRLAPKDNTITISRLRKAFYDRFSTVDNLIIVKDANRQVNLPSDLQVIELPDTYSCGSILPKLTDRDTFNIFIAFSDSIYNHIKNKVKISAASKAKYERLKNLKDISNINDIIWQDLNIL